MAISGILLASALAPVLMPRQRIDVVSARGTRRARNLGSFVLLWPPLPRGWSEQRAQPGMRIRRNCADTYLPVASPRLRPGTSADPAATRNGDAFIFHTADSATKYLRPYVAFPTPPPTIHATCLPAAINVLACSVHT